MSNTSIWKKLDANCERWLLLVFYTMIVVTVGVEVLRRFVFSYSSVWGEEIARYAFIYLVWIGLAVVNRDRSSIRINFLLQFLTPKIKALFYLFGDFCMLFVSIFALFYSIMSFSTSIEFGSVTHGLRISNAWFLFALPFGFTLTIFRLVQSIIRDLNDFRNNRKVFEGKKLFD